MPSVRSQSQKDPIAIALGDVVQTRRNDRGLSREECAELAKMSVMQWGRIERGENITPYPTLQRVAKTLRMKISEMFKEAGY